MEAAPCRATYLDEHRKELSIGRCGRLLRAHHVLEACRIGHKEDDSVVISLRGEHISVERHKGLTLLDRIAHLHLRLEAATVELNRIDTDMNE